MGDVEDVQEIVGNLGSVVRRWCHQGDAQSASGRWMVPDGEMTVTAYRDGTVMGSQSSETAHPPRDVTVIVDYWESESWRKPTGEDDGSS